MKSCSGGNSVQYAASGSSGCQFTTAVLTAAGATTTAPPGCALQGCVVLNFNETRPGGANNPCAAAVNTCPRPRAERLNDPLGMTTNGIAPAGELTDTFGQYDWVVRLSPITYCVNTTNAADPQLMRTRLEPQNP